MLSINDFCPKFYATRSDATIGEISDAILLGGATSAQISIKYYDLACNVEPPLLKIVRI